LQNAEKDFIEGQAVCLCFFVGMVVNTDALISDSVNDVLDVHCKTLASILPDYSIVMDAQRAG